jgi:hypothetical protein
MSLDSYVTLELNYKLQIYVNTNVGFFFKQVYLYITRSSPVSTLR